MRTLASISLAAALLLGACSGPEEDAVSETAPPAAEDVGTPRTPRRPSPAKPGAEPSRRDTTSREDRDPSGDGDPSSDAATDADVDDDAEVSDDEPEGAASAALHPAAGRYVYDQSGYERFCQAAACDQRSLSPRQPVRVSLAQRGPERAVVVSEIASSDGRMLRTKTTFTHRDARVTDVFARFSYEGFTFESSYRPRPPVQSLRFPLKKGAAWFGSWEDSTSGNYSVDVLGRDAVQVDGAAVGAYKLATVTEFRGELTGSSKAILWVDPATKSVIKTSGKIDLRSSFGRYVTEFNTRLRSGPRYP